MGLQDQLVLGAREFDQLMLVWALVFNQLIEEEGGNNRQPVQIYIITVHTNIPSFDSLRSTLRKQTNSLGTGFWFCPEGVPFMYSTICLYCTTEKKCSH
jgi:hypothetical protein